MESHADDGERKDEKEENTNSFHGSLHAIPETGAFVSEEIAAADFFERTDAFPLAAVRLFETFVALEAVVADVNIEREDGMVVRENGFVG